MTYLKIGMIRLSADSYFKYPQVTADLSHCLKARQLTLFYRLLPYLCRIHAKA
jgi:hypothetical protein